MADDQTPLDPPDDIRPSNATAEPTVTQTSEPSAPFDPHSVVRKFELWHGTGKQSKPDTLAVSAPKKLTKHELQLARQLRRERAYQLFLQDWTYRQIAKELGISAKNAFRHVKTYEAEREEHDMLPIANRRRQLVARTAAVRKPMWAVIDNPKACDEDRIAAAEVILLALKREAMLTGADMPTKVASTNVDGTSWAPLVLQLQNSLSIEELRVLERVAKLRLSAGTILEGEQVG